MEKIRITPTHTHTTMIAPITATVISIGVIVSLNGCQWLGVYLELRQPGLFQTGDSRDQILIAGITSRDHTQPLISVRHRAFLYLSGSCFYLFTDKFKPLLSPIQMTIGYILGFIYLMIRIP